MLLTLASDWSAALYPGLWLVSSMLSVALSPSSGCWCVLSRPRSALDRLHQSRAQSASPTPSLIDLYSPSTPGGSGLLLHGDFLKDMRDIRELQTLASLPVCRHHRHKLVLSCTSLASLAAWLTGNEKFMTKTVGAGVMQWCDHTWADIWWWPTGDVTSLQVPVICTCPSDIIQALSSVCVKSFELWLSVTCSWCVSDFWAIRTWIWLEWYISTWYFATTRHRQLPSLSLSVIRHSSWCFLSSCVMSLALYHHHLLVDLNTDLHSIVLAAVSRLNYFPAPFLLWNLVPIFSEMPGAILGTNCGRWSHLGSL